MTQTGKLQIALCIYPGEFGSWSYEHITAEVSFRLNYRGAGPEQASTVEQTSTMEQVSTVKCI